MKTGREGGKGSKPKRLGAAGAPDFGRRVGPGCQTDACEGGCRVDTSPTGGVADDSGPPAVDGARIAAVRSGCAGRRDDSNFQPAVEAGRLDERALCRDFESLDAGGPYYPREAIFTASTRL